GERRLLGRALPQAHAHRVVAQIPRGQPVRGRLPGRHGSREVLRRVHRPDAHHLAGGGHQDRALNAMRALRIHGYGGPEVMRLEEVPAPSAGPAQVLVKVSAASVNPIDWKMRRGMLASIFPLSFPRTLGRDCAGEANGALVAGVADPRTDGTHAEYALLPHAATAPVPAGLDAAAAASPCVAGLSAWIPLADVA